ncbi:oxidoreductase [Vibrio sp. HN007]|uniref:oxidoreductase n=1 Tax=Vibrio iocasae TaxID=3098914 RepID=UPI0035D3EAFC
MNEKWTVKDIQSLNSKVAIVTGGNTGLGFQSALTLAKAGCDVIIGCRDTRKGTEAMERVLQVVPDANIKVQHLDLTDFSSISAFTSSFTDQHQRLDILLNNAGVVNLSSLQHTSQGHEMHFATNHLGHFCLTGHLLPTIKKTPNARVVTVSSGGYKFGEIRFDDLNWQIRPYHRVKSYGDSKLANMLFYRQLHHLFESNDVNAKSIAAHPGLTASERQQTEGIGGVLSRFAASPIQCGVQPLLRACCDPECKSGDFIGPRFGIRGRPVKTSLNSSATDSEVAEKLWDYSSEVTGVRYEF